MADTDDHYDRSDHDAITAPPDYTGEGDEADLDDLPPDDRAVADPLLDFARGGLESLGWRTAEIASLQLSPLGPVVVRSLHLGRQALQAVRGVINGEGFYLKVTVPGLDILGDTGPFELAAHVRLGQTRPDPEGGADIRPDIQFFKPWFENLDVAPVRTPTDVPERGVEISTPEPDGEDPWRVWLLLLGDDLIHNLAETLCDGRALPTSEVLGTLQRTEREAERRYLRSA